MEKNKSLRAASGLFILVLVTTCIIGATFAKYTTTGTANDMARVAKWGVSINMSTDDDNGIFKTTYATDDENVKTTINNSVVAVTKTDNTQDKVVAPGTTGSTTFTISGTPEVAFKLTAGVDIVSTIKVTKDADCTMGSGKFEKTEVKVQPTVDYEPIKFKIEKKGADGSFQPLKTDAATGEISDTGTDAAENLSLAQLEAALESLSVVHEANSNVNEEYKITWTWPFETSFNSWKNDEGYKSSYANADVLDTYLGNEATMQTEQFDITVTATQID